MTFEQFRPESAVLFRTLATNPVCVPIDQDRSGYPGNWWGSSRTARARTAPFHNAFEIHESRLVSQTRRIQEGQVGEGNSRPLCCFRRISRIPPSDPIWPSSFFRYAAALCLMSCRWGGLGRPRLQFFAIELHTTLQFGPLVAEHCRRCPHFFGRYCFSSSATAFLSAVFIGVRFRSERSSWRSGRSRLNAIPKGEYQRSPGTSTDRVELYGPSSRASRQLSLSRTSAHTGRLAPSKVVRSSHKEAA